MKYFFLVLAALLTASLPLMADGGRIRLHERSGPFLITLFTTPDPLSAGPADLSVAVERLDRAGIVEDAEVTLFLTGPGGTRMVQAATHEAATSRFLYSANLSLPESGVWRGQVNVSEGNLAGACETRMEVLPLTPLRQQMYWQIAAVPCAVLLFFLHLARRRWLERRRRQMRLRA